MYKQEQFCESDMMQYKSKLFGKVGQHEPSHVCFFTYISRSNKYINLVWVLPKGEPKTDT